MERITDEVREKERKHNNLINRPPAPNEKRYRANEESERQISHRLIPVARRGGTLPAGDSARGRSCSDSVNGARPEGIRHP